MPVRQQIVSYLCLSRPQIPSFVSLSSCVQSQLRTKHSARPALEVAPYCIRLHSILRRRPQRTILQTRSTAQKEADVGGTRNRVSPEVTFPLLPGGSLQLLQCVRTGSCVSTYNIARFSDWEKAWKLRRTQPRVERDCVWHVSWTRKGPKRSVTSHHVECAFSKC